MKLLWFGDSYTVGNELGYTHGAYSTTMYDDKIVYINLLDKDRGRPDLAFPIIVSKKLDCDFLHYGLGGASIKFMEFSLFNFIKTRQRNEEKYLGIFCFPGQYNRFFTVKNDNNWIYQTSNNIKTDILKQQVEYGKYETTVTLNSIYSSCLTHNIQPIFVNSWLGIELLENYNIVPDNIWLLPKEKSLIEYAWDFKDPPESWRSSIKNKETYLKYISPCENHPNIDGHQKLSEVMSKLLSNYLSLSDCPATNLF